MMKKFVRLLAVSLTLGSVTPYVWADRATIIGAPDGFCKRWLDTRVQVKLANPSSWLQQCAAAAQVQDQCVRSTGWQSMTPATPQTTKCWMDFEAALKAIPTGVAGKGGLGN